MTQEESGTGIAGPGPGPGPIPGPGPGPGLGPGPGPDIETGPEPVTLQLAGIIKTDSRNLTSPKSNSKFGKYPLQTIKAGTADWLIGDSFKYYIL